MYKQRQAKLVSFERSEIYGSYCTESQSGWPDGAICRQKGDKMRSVATLKKMKIAPFLGNKKGDFGLKKV